MFGGHLLPLPVHAGRLPVVDLHAVHAHVALSAFRVSGDHAGEGDKAAAIQRPALEYGKVQHAEVFPQDDLLAGRVFRRHGAGKEPAYFRQHGKHLQLSQQAFGRFELEQALDTSRHIIEAIHIERQLHTPLAAKLVHQYPAARVPLYVLKKKCRSTRSTSTFTRFRHSVGNLGDLENGVNWLANVL